MPFSLKDSSLLRPLGGGVVNHRSLDEELSSWLLQYVEPSDVYTNCWNPHSILLGLSNIPNQPETNSYPFYDGLFTTPKYIPSLDAPAAPISSSLPVPSQYLYSSNCLNYGPGVSWADIVNDQISLPRNEVFAPSQSLPMHGGMLFPGYTSHPLVMNLNGQMNATTAPSFVFGVPAPFPTDAARFGYAGPWGYQPTSCLAPFSSQAAYRPMDIEISTALPLTAAPPCDPVDWWEPLQDSRRSADMPPVLSSPSISSLSDYDPPPPPHTSPAAPVPAAISEPAPLAGRTAVMIRKRQGSYLKPTIGKDTQSGYCRWEHCGELIACDRSSVNDHMRRHIQDLYERGLLFTSSDGRPFKGPVKSRPMSKCQTHCRWRDDIPCPYSDVYESKTHEAMLRKKRRKMQKKLGRGVKRSDWGRNIHVRHSDTPSEESDSETQAKGGRSRRVQPNGSLITVQSLIKHICGTHLLSLMMTCEDCDERFSRTDAYGRHRKEVHDGEPRGKNH